MYFFSLLLPHFFLMILFLVNITFFWFKIISNGICLRQNVLFGKNSCNACSLILSVETSFSVKSEIFSLEVFLFFKTFFPLRAYVFLFFGNLKRTPFERGEKNRIVITRQQVFLAFSNSRAQKSYENYSLISFS
jgi:hypothetical protein